MNSSNTATSDAADPAATKITPGLRFAYRLICVATVIAAASLAFNLFSQSKRSVGDANEAEIQRVQLQRAEETLAKGRQQRDELKEMIARAQQDLTASEHAKAAAATH